MYVLPACEQNDVSNCHLHTDQRDCAFNEQTLDLSITLQRLLNIPAILARYVNEVMKAKFRTQKSPSPPTS